MARVELTTHGPAVGELAVELVEVPPPARRRIRFEAGSPGRPVVDGVLTDRSAGDPGPGLKFRMRRPDRRRLPQRRRAGRRHRALRRARRCRSRRPRACTTRSATSTPHWASTGTVSSTCCSRVCAAGEGRDAVPVLKLTDVGELGTARRGPCRRGPRRRAPGAAGLVRLVQHAPNPADDLEELGLCPGTAREPPMSTDRSDTSITARREWQLAGIRPRASGSRTCPTASSRRRERGRHASASATATRCSTWPGPCTTRGSAPGSLDAVPRPGRPAGRWPAGLGGRDPADGAAGSADRGRRGRAAPASRWTQVRLHLPFEVADYVDFYSSRAPRHQPRAGCSGPTRSR